MKGSYIRSGDADRLMTEYEVYSFEAFKKKIQDELRVSERAVMKDMQTKAFDLYINLLRNKKPNLAELPNEDLCRLQGLCCFQVIRRLSFRSFVSRRYLFPVRK